MADERKVNAPLIVTIGLVSATLVLVIIIGVQAWYYEAYQEERDRKADLATNTKLADLRLEHRENISTYQWIDEKAGVVRIPIDRAIPLWLERANAAGSGRETP